MSDGVDGKVKLIVRVACAAEYLRLELVGNIPELGNWQLSKSIKLEYFKSDDDDEGTITWTTPPIEVPLSSYPLKLRLVANAHRNSPTTRPVIWDQNSRRLQSHPEDGVVTFMFEPTADDSDSGWVHNAGAGSFQLRVGKPPGSQESLVALLPEFQGGNHFFRVDLYEAHGRDPAVPQGKPFARLKYADMGILHDPDTNPDENAVTFLLNAQTLEALEFRVDVVSVTDGTLIARGYVPVHVLLGLEGTVVSALVSPRGLQHAGTFRAAFLVVTELPHTNNHLGGLQRSRWVPNAPTLDIGHRGSGASKVHGHSVRENTLLSFQKAALNHSDYIEFDVHVTSDGEVVVHHDFEVKLALGREEVRVALPLLRGAQLRSPEFAQYMVIPTEHGLRPAIDVERARRNRTLKRTMTSGEDLFHSIFNKTRLSMSPDTNGDALGPARAFLSDTTATLKEAFERTPPWLGFNIELKYPTEEETAAMGARFYSRNYFVDAVLRVVLEEARGRRVIFSTFDPDCATLLSLKQPRYPVFFLTCGGTKHFTDPRMNSLEAALQFALTSKLQGVVAEATSVLERLDGVVEEFHRHGLFLFTWGDVNNDIVNYTKQKHAGVDAIIMDDIARIAHATNKTQPSLFAHKQLRSPSSFAELASDPMACEVRLRTLERMSSSFNILAMSPVGSPHIGFTGMLTRERDIPV